MFWGFFIWNCGSIAPVYKQKQIRRERKEQKKLPHVNSVWGLYDHDFRDNVFFMYSESSSSSDFR